MFGLRMNTSEIASVGTRDATRRIPQSVFLPQSVIPEYVIHYTWRVDIQLQVCVESIKDLHQRIQTTL